MGPGQSTTAVPHMIRSRVANSVGPLGFCRKKYKGRYITTTCRAGEAVAGRVGEAQPPVWARGRLTRLVSAEAA